MVQRGYAVVDSITDNHATFLICSVQVALPIVVHDHFFAPGGEKRVVGMLGSSAVDCT